MADVQPEHLQINVYGMKVWLTSILIEVEDFLYGHAQVLHERVSSSVLQ